MNRKQFIESHDATCKNWTWSWSFINEKEKFIIFGAWDVYVNGNMVLIFKEDWKLSAKGKNQPGYEQSREHLRFIEEEGYQLKIFPMEYMAANDEEGAPAKIKKIIPELFDKTLIRIGDSWYASDQTFEGELPEEVNSKEVFIEGAVKSIPVNQYERSAAGRLECLKHYGYTCSVCSFDFEKKYGAIGKNYIHVHHIIPIAEIGKEYELNPIKDLRPVCPNCHAMIHKTRPALTIQELRDLV
jgi:5-methylcytosine-specific restriction enzyme A